MKLTTLASTKKDYPASDAIFAAPINKALLAQAVYVYRNNERQGTAKTKTRSEINRTHKKWFKQKGTGNARHGARNPNIFVGGGVSHGPNGQQNYSAKLTTKMKQKALVSALSWQAPQILVCDALNDLDGKTKSAAALLKTQLASNDTRILIVVDQITPLQRRSLNNLTSVLTVSASRLNTLQVLHADTIIFTGPALDELAKRLAVKA